MPKPNNRPRVFYLHFNRIAMQRGDPKVWSVRTSRGCYHAEQVICTAPIETVFKPKSQQPRAFFKGMGFVYQELGKPIIHISPTKEVQ